MNSKMWMNDKIQSSNVVVLNWDAFSTNGWKDNDYTRTARWAEPVSIKNNRACSLKAIAFVSHRALAFNNLRWNGYAFIRRYLVTNFLLPHFDYSKIIHVVLTQFSTTYLHASVVMKFIGYVIYTNMEKFLFKFTL